jgi:osmotically inducible lipoprotein OsmB
MAHMMGRTLFYGMATFAMIAGTSSPAHARDMERKDRNTLIGAGIGALGGAVLSHGDIWGTIAGAAAGGVVGNVATKGGHRHDDRRYRDDDRGRDRGRDDYRGQPQRGSDWHH